MLKEVTCMSTQYFCNKPTAILSEFNWILSNIGITNCCSRRQENSSGNASSYQQSRIYSGYSDWDEEGKWVDVMGNFLSWNNWKSNSPVSITISSKYTCWYICFSLLSIRSFSIFTLQDHARYFSLVHAVYLGFESHARYLGFENHCRYLGFENHCKFFSLKNIWW